MIRGRIRVTEFQWEAVVQGSEIVSKLEHANRAMLALDRTLGEGVGAVGRSLNTAVRNLVASAVELGEIASDATWFSPPDPADPKAIHELVSAIRLDVAELLDRLMRRERTGTGSPCIVENYERLVTRPANDALGDDRFQRVYGVSLEAPIGAPLGLGARLRAAFFDRPDELDDICADLVSFASRERKLVEGLDPGQHPMSLAVMDDPLWAHRVARAVCDLVHHQAPQDVAPIVAAVVENSQRGQDALSAHREMVETRRRLADPLDGEAATRHIVRLYGTTLEGPLKAAAVATLRILGHVVSQTAGLNEISSQLQSRQDRSPLCGMLAGLIKPRWRNAAAHGRLSWDPESETAMFDGHAEDLHEVRRTTDLAWMAARAFQAGMAIARSCLPDLGRAVDVAESKFPAISRDIQLGKLFSGQGLTAWPAQRGPGRVVVTVDDVADGQGPSRVGSSLVGAADTEPTVEWWCVDFGRSLPPFEVSATVIEVARTLCGRDRSKGYVFWYPPAFAPLLADALVLLGTPDETAARIAWELPLRDTLHHLGKLARDGRWSSPDELAELRRASLRTNDAVRAVARHLGLGPPARLNLTAICALIRALEVRPRDQHTIHEVEREHARLERCLAPEPVGHPWADLQA